MRYESNAICCLRLSRGLHPAPPRPAPVPHHTALRHLHKQGRACIGRGRSTRTRLLVNRVQRCLTHPPPGPALHHTALRPELDAGKFRLTLDSCYRRALSPSTGIYSSRALALLTTCCSVADRATSLRIDINIAMAAKCFIMFACLVLAHGSMVRRDAPNVWEEIQKHTEDIQKVFSEQFNTFVNSKNTQDFNKVVKDGSESMLQQLTALSNSLQSVLNDANGKAKEALEQARKNIEKTAEELRKAHPDVEKQATALREKLQTAVQNTVQESHKLAKAVATNMDQTNQKLAPKFKEAFDDFVKHAQEVQKKLHEAATKQ